MKKKEFWVYFSILIILILIVVSNMMIQGITCNDEVQLRLNSQHGLLYFLRKQIVEEDIYQGRILGALGNIKFISFISTNVYVFRAIEMAILLIAIGLFGVFVCEIFKNKKIGILSTILALVFLPITFEHSVPNAFVIVVCQPLILLLLSLLCYLRFFKVEKKRYIIFSCILFFWGCCLYEFVVTYIFLFFVIALLKQDKNGSYIMVLKKCVPHIVTAVVYLSCYFLQGRIFPTKYEGTSVNIFNITGILNVLKIEWLSSLPGYYLFNKKYKYLHNIYSAKIDMMMITIIIIFIISLTTILVKLLNNNSMQKRNIKRSILIALTAVAYTIIPTIPNSITPLYQECVSENYFTSIPVSLFLYLAIIFLITWGTWSFTAKFPNFFLFPICIMTILGTCVYITNKGIAEQQFKDYNRFVSIEELLSTNFWANYPELQIEAPSLFETRDNLAIESGHWTDYISLYNGGNIQIDSDNDNANCFIQMQDNNSFYMVLNNANYYITKDDDEDIFLIKNLNGESQIAHKKNGIWKDKEFVFFEIEVD